MTVIGFSFKKMLVERHGPVKGKISINNNVGIKNLEETKINVNQDKKAFKVDFEFTSKYDPNIGNVLLEGEVVYLVDKAKAADVTKSWEKNKKIDKDMMTDILNNVLAKCNVQALILTKDMNLPPPIPMPKVDGSKQ